MSTVYVTSEFNFNTSTGTNYTFGGNDLLSISTLSSSALDFTGQWSGSTTNTFVVENFCLKIDRRLIE